MGKAGGSPIQGLVKKKNTAPLKLELAPCRFDSGPGHQVGGAQKGPIHDPQEHRV